jgi:hypothetical protein
MEKEQENSGLSDDATEANHFLLAKLEQTQTGKTVSCNAYVYAWYCQTLHRKCV